MDSRGWIKLHRQFYTGKIAHQPPHFREIFIWLFVHANHQEARSSGTMIKRGQLFTSYKSIIEALSWFVGYRKEEYPKHKIESAMNWFKNNDMIHTEKSTRGMLVTICNYNKYQSENINITNTKPTENSTENIQSNDSINKNGRKEEENSISIAFSEFWEAYDKKKGNKSDIKCLWDELSAQYQKAVMDFIPNYKMANPDKKFRCNPKTFLLDRRWEDEEMDAANNEPDLSPSNKSILSEYDIPKDDLFGFTDEELLKRINNGLYEKR